MANSVMPVATTDHWPISGMPPMSPQPPPSQGDASPSFATVLRGLGRELDSGEHTMQTAMQAMSASAAMSPAQLIVLQARVYRYSEAIDLSSRLVDRSAASVKTVLQGSNT